MSVSIHDLREWRKRGQKFVMVTAYDALTARICDEAGIPLLLVGDSVANVLLGLPDDDPGLVRRDAASREGRRTRLAGRAARRRPAVGQLPGVDRGCDPQRVGVPARRDALA